jgi:trehalose 6-phosphate phosphatase
MRACAASGMKDREGSDMVERTRSAPDGAAGGERPHDAGTDAPLKCAQANPAAARPEERPVDARPGGEEPGDTGSTARSSPSLSSPPGADGEPSSDGERVRASAPGSRTSSDPASGDRSASGAASGDPPSSGPASSDRPSSGPAFGDRPSSGPAFGDRPSSGQPGARGESPGRAAEVAGPDQPFFGDPDEAGADFSHAVEDDVQPLQPGVDAGTGGCAGPQLRHLSSAEGQAALVALMRGSVLFAFDFDGTLAPIRPRPGDVQVSATLALRLEKLARLRPVAIVTGRRIDDVRGRLGFTPTWIVGNHGAEDDGDPEAALRAAQALDPLRRRIEARADGLQDAGVAIEDKGQSLALHFRTAPDRDAARALIDEVLAGFTPQLHVFGGKLVVNAVAADAPDKAVAVRRLLARAGAQNAFFAGDDVNDEPVFAAAQPGWVTVRIGCDRRGMSAARFCIDGPHEMAVVLDRILALADGGG